MNNLELFKAALGLQDPWMVASMDFDAAGHRLDLHLDFARGSRFPCPEGDEEACAVHDTSEKTWRHLDFFQHQAYLHARVPRVACPAHGVRQVAVPWARPDSGFTLLFEALVMALVTDMPVRAAADLVGEHDTRLWRVLHHYVEVARSARDDAAVRQVGIDETSARRGQDYISLFVDLERSAVLYATEDRDHCTVRRFATDLAAHGGDPDAVTDACCDMSPAYILGIETSLPNAEITFDRYHLAQLLSKALDSVRRDEAPSRSELRRTRYLWLKRPEKLSDRQRADLAWLRVQGRGLRTARAYRWRLAFDAFFDQPPELAEEYLDRWYRGAIRSRLEPIKDFAYTVGEHWDGVLRWHTTRISNGVLEGINSLVQAAKRRARGYRTTANLIAMTYLIAGKLDMASAHTK
ncbi:MAG TPA: ISL3 family transposase [Actinomycetota bacterium]